MENFDLLLHPILRSCDFLVNYGPDAVAQTLNRLVSTKKLGLDPEEIPVLSHGRAWRRVYEVCLSDDQRYGHQVPEALSKVPCANKPLVLADPLTSILFATLNVARMKKHYFVTYFKDVRGQLWGIHMDALTGEFILHIHPTCTNAIHREATVFLATPSRPLSWAA